MEHLHDGHRERLRERYFSGGADVFSDHELLELLLTYAIPRRDTNELSHTLLNRFGGSLEQVLHASVAELAAVPGMGERSAALLRLVSDTMRRVATRRFSDGSGKVRLATPATSAQYAHALLADQTSESVLLLCLNAQRVLTAAVPVGGGTVAEASVYPRTVAEQALLRHAHAVLLVHNHPSGNPCPSAADVETTAAVSAALSGIGVCLLDHLIVGHGCVYSSSAGVVLLFDGDEVDTVTPEDYAARQRTVRPALSLVMEQYQS